MTGHPDQPPEEPTPATPPSSDLPSDHRPSAQPPVEPAQSAPPPQRERGGRVVAALVLIGLGLFFLAANVLPGAGSWLFIALGVAFLAARFVTGQYGFAVPAGILLGFGSFVVLQQVRLLPGDSGGWFFVLLGLGFLATYVLGGRSDRVWPLFPAAALAGFGLLLLGGVPLGPLREYVWIATFWPIVLILIGLWLLLRRGVSRNTGG